MSDVHMTYENISEKAADRAQLAKFLDAIDATPNALRLDDCECWVIKGRFGYVSTWGDGKGFLLAIVGGGKAKQWAYDKRRLSFCDLTQDGHDEGCFYLRRLPIIKTEGEAIRVALGIHQRKRYTKEQLAASSARAKQLKPRS
jgi:hypothetical protein